MTSILQASASARTEPLRDAPGVLQCRSCAALPCAYLTADRRPLSASSPAQPSLQEKKKKYEPPAPPPRVGRKQKKRDRADGLGSKLPTVVPNAKCKLRLLKLERVKDYLLMEEEFVKTQELRKPQEERNEEDRTKVRRCLFKCVSVRMVSFVVWRCMLISVHCDCAACLTARSCKGC